MFCAGKEDKNKLFERNNQFFSSSFFSSFHPLTDSICYFYKMFKNFEMTLKFLYLIMP
jgi:hypothetical protein